VIYVVNKYFEKHPMCMIVIGVIGISLSSIFVRYSSAPSTVTAAFRLIWTVLLMSPVILGSKVTRRELLEVDRKSLAMSSISGVFLAVHFVVWFESLQYTSVASSTTIVCTEVIWVALGFCLFMKGKLSWKAAMAIVVTFAGSILIAYADSAVGETHFWGDVLAWIAAVAVAVYTLLGRIVRSKVSTGIYTYIVYVSCAVVLVLMCLIQGQHLFSYGWRAVLVGLLLALFSTIMGHSIFSWCLKYFSPAFVSASKLCEPLVAAVFASMLFDEQPSWLQVLGGILILGGVFYYSILVKHKNDE